MRPCSALLALLPCLLLAARPCFAQEPYEESHEEREAREHSQEIASSFEKTGEGRYSHNPFDAPQRRVIRNAAEWKAAWMQLWGDSPPAYKFPRVNFKKHMVLLVSSGKPSSGYEVIIQEVVQHKDRLEVTVVTARSCRECLNLKYPLALKRIPRTRTPVRFIEK
jgi:hypothetical protein